MRDMAQTRIYLKDGKQVKVEIGTHQFVNEDDIPGNNEFHPMGIACKVCRCWLASDGKIFRPVSPIGRWEEVSLKCHLAILLD